MWAASISFEAAEARHTLQQMNPFPMCLSLVCCIMSVLSNTVLLTPFPCSFHECLVSYSLHQIHPTPEVPLHALKINAVLPLNVPSQHVMAAEAPHNSKQLNLFPMGLSLVCCHICTCNTNLPPPPFPYSFHKRLGSYSLCQLHPAPEMLAAMHALDAVLPLDVCGQHVIGGRGCPAHLAADEPVSHGLLVGVLPHVRSQQRRGEDDPVAEAALQATAAHRWGQGRVVSVVLLVPGLGIQVLKNCQGSDLQLCFAHGKGVECYALGICIDEIKSSSGYC